jgi:bifunctional non-homologous end joining protein LigD
LREDKPASAVIRECAARPKEEAMPAPRRYNVGPKRVAVAGVTLSHPERVLFREQGLTKHDLAAYYAAVAEWMLPHVLARPLTLMRCPQGRNANCFVQKHPGRFAPAGTRRVLVPESSREEYLVADNASGLVGLVQIGVLEFHVGGATTADLTRPDRLVFDLDPDPGVEWRLVVGAAREVADRLTAQGLVSFVKTTGGKGLHVVAPIAPGPRWPAVKRFAKAFAGAMAADSPGRYTTNMRKAERAGRIFGDYLRNDSAATAIAPYSTRARAGATVAMPIDWSELTPALVPAAFSVATVPDLLRARAHDPWSAMADVEQTLPMSRKAS